jgi:hypothetical protein
MTVMVPYLYIMHEVLSICISCPNKIMSYKNQDPGYPTKTVPQLNLRPTALQNKRRRQ